MKKSNNRFYVTSYDKLILLLYLSLVVIGMLIMLDISSVQSSLQNFYRHMANVAVSLVVVLYFLYYSNMSKLRHFNSALIGVTIALLIAVLLMGENVKGATRSISLGIVNFQPSFLARIALIFFLANIMDKKKAELSATKISDLVRNFSPVILVTGLIYGLILKGQHLSSLIISAATLVCMLFLGGLRFRFVLIGALICLIAGVSVIKFGAGYRGGRLDIYKKYSLFFNKSVPDSTSEKEYQVKESLTALTSGKLFGTGPDSGRAKHYYLPEARTDYVFTVIGEEFGFLGAMIVFGLHCLLFYKIMLMAFKQTDYYLQMVAMGLGLNIFLNVLVNVGVSMSILPSTGNTLPFISYSGTAMLMDSLSIGIILNISAKRKVI
jgi:cell division protein FtsW (lipid II flippase)